MADRELVQMLVRDNHRMRRAGCQLAEAAMRVVREADGLHRLSLAIAEWAEAIAAEGDRPHKLPRQELARTIVADRERGFSLRQIAHRHGIGLGKVRGALKAHSNGAGKV